jgi:hypothetical protein
MLKVSPRLTLKVLAVLGHSRSALIRLGLQSDGSSRGRRDGNSSVPGN